MLDHVDEEVVVGPVVDGRRHGDQEQGQPAVEEQGAQSPRPGPLGAGSPAEVGQAGLVEHHDDRHDDRRTGRSSSCRPGSSRRPSVCRRDAGRHGTPAALSSTSRRPAGSGSTAILRPRLARGCQREDAERLAVHREGIDVAVRPRRARPRATPAPRFSRGGGAARFHVPAGATSTASRRAASRCSRRTATSPAAFTAVDPTDVPEPMASGRSPSTARCRSATARRGRADRRGWPAPARSSRLPSTAPGARWSPLPGMRRRSVSPALCQDPAVRVNRPTLPPRRQPVAISGAPLGRSVAPSSPFTPQPGDTRLSAVAVTRGDQAGEADRGAQRAAPTQHGDDAPGGS